MDTVVLGNVGVQMVFFCAGAGFVVFGSACRSGGECGFGGDE